MKPLIGIQLPLLSGVAPYLVSNPAACAICTQQRVARGLSHPCPICQPLSPEQPSPGLYAQDPPPSILIVTEQLPDFPQPSLSPEQAFAIGDEIKILAVQPHQSKRWIGRRGTVNKFSKTRVWVKLPGLTGSKPVEVPLPVDCLEKLPTLRRSRQRRYSPKGTASGWLEERQGNRKRKTPSTSYYYGWLEKGIRKKCYVPVGKIYRVHDMITQRRTVAEILAFLGVQPTPDHHD
ncbi:MAG: hypothetical protein ACFCVD_02160 [Nodosilinea sp.]